MADLKPDVGMWERAWKITEEAIKVYKLILEFVLLLIDNAQTKQIFTFLVEI